MPVVRMPNGDQVRFPDEWSQEQIGAKIKEKFPEPSKDSVPIGGYVGQTLKGAAQNVAEVADVGLDLLTGPMDALPRRKQLHEFANAPYTPGYETAGRIGYWGVPAAGAAKIGIAGARGVAAGAKAAPKYWNALSPELQELAKNTAATVGPEVAIDLVLGHLTGFGGLAGFAARKGFKALRAGMKGAAKGAAEGAGEEAAAAESAAVAPGRLGTVNEHGLRASPGWTPEQQAALEKTHVKPRVRVQAPSRPARDDIND